MLDIQAPTDLTVVGATNDTLKVNKIQYISTIYQYKSYISEIQYICVAKLGCRQRSG